jgi:hypothetical protein
MVGCIFNSAGLIITREIPCIFIEYSLTNTNSVVPKTYFNVNQLKVTVTKWLLEPHRSNNKL